MFDTPSGYRQIPLYYLNYFENSSSAAKHPLLNEASPYKVFYNNVYFLKSQKFIK